MFQHKSIFTFFFCAVVVSLSNAQMIGELPDTLELQQRARSYTMPEYVVSATRWQIRARDLPSSATVLTAADLLESNGSFLSNALEGTPGLFLKSYGGPGSVSTTSLRGMGAEHTLVLIDGQRYNNVRDGQVDFGTFLLQNVDRIEILRGGFSSIYGADAVGGIVNIITRRPDGKANVKAEITGGSYGMNGECISSGFALGGATFELAAQRESGKGDFEFDFNDGLSSSVLRRQNADYSVSQVQLLADVMIEPDLALHVSSSYDRSDRGSPDAVLSRMASNAARLHDEEFLAQASLDWTVRPAMSIRLSTLFNGQQRRYEDPLASGGPDNEQTSCVDRTVTLTPVVRYVLSSASSISSGLEYSHSTISGNQVAGADRNQESIFLSTDHIVQFPQELLYQINIYPSLRYDHFSDVRGAVDPKIGINIGLWRPLGLRLKSSLGSSFRAPTFNDLYWKNGGNPALRPERSLSFDAGIAVSYDFLGPLDFEANYFNIRTSDRILWTPDAGGIWTPKNLQEVRSSGLEFVAATHLASDHIILRLSYSNADTRKTSTDRPDDLTLNKQLPYIPHEMAAVSLALRLGFLNANVHHTVTGFRFSTETNDPKFLLPSYNRTDVNLSAQVVEHPVRIDARLEMSNLFNTDYQLFPNYPMPLRTFALKLLLSY